MEIFVRDDLVKVGVTEDGDDDIARSFYLVAEAADGRRWAHDHCVVAHLGGAEKAAAGLETLRAKVAAHLDRGGRLTEAHWVEIDPRYGSDAYQGLDAIGYFRAVEIVRAADHGEPVNSQLEWEARSVLDAVA